MVKYALRYCKISYWLIIRFAENNTWCLSYYWCSR